ncbi:MAG: prolipoprotein diacylglyceryl transferase [Clostridia bacterium]
MINVMINSPFLIVGFIMALTYALRFRKHHGFSVLQMLIFIPVALGLDLLGERLLYFFNYGSWGGHFFYGGVMLLPLFIVPLILVLRMNYLKSTDLLAIVSMAVRWIAKIGNCGIIRGCCGGIELFEFNGEMITFPSQVVEGLTLLVMGLLFIKLSKNEKYRGLIYGYYYIIYGITRAIFESLRIDEKVYQFGVPVAQFWCLIIIGLGIAWLILVPLYKKKSKRYIGIIEKEKQLEEELEKVEDLEKIRKQKQKQAKQKSK